MRRSVKGKQSSHTIGIEEAAFRQALGRWFQENGRDLPWRHTRDAYAILVSEVMLQQTQVRTVGAYYKEWLRRFPDVRVLADAHETSVLRMWEGLGYYSRARNLHRCAKVVVKKFGGRLPSDPAELQSLPGLGRYTANAIAVFAFDKTLPIVEANTARVLARVFNVREPIDSTAGRLKLWDHSARLVPERDARKFHSALMDLGAIVCTARNPRCGICPVANFCRTRDPGSFPKKRKRASTVMLTESHDFITCGERIRLEQCSKRWRGMWMLPENSAPTGELIYQARFPFTHYVITLAVFCGQTCRLTSTQRWFMIRRLKEIPIPSPHRRALDILLPTRG